MTTERAEREDNTLHWLNHSYGYGVLNGVGANTLRFETIVGDMRMSRVQRHTLLDQFRCGQQHGRELAKGTT